MSAAKASRKPERLTPASSLTSCHTSWLSVVRYAWIAFRSSAMPRTYDRNVWMLFCRLQDFIKFIWRAPAASIAFKVPAREWRRVSSDPTYDRIGLGYRTHRRPEPQWVSAIHAALGDAASVLNVGAGTGSYEPNGLHVIAVEPSSTMLAQRAADAAPAVRSIAEQLPFPDRRFDVGLAVLTVHHWSDPAAGFAELRRVTERQVVFTWDHRVSPQFWLVREYVPELAAHDDGVAALTAIHEHLDITDEIELLVPANCIDGVLAAYWRRPEAYLDPTVRANISGLSLLDPAVVAAAMDRLRADLDDGTWAARHADLLALDQFDAGYRLLLARS
jgi:SAM-dependent methyltransferase